MQLISDFINKAINKKLSQIKMEEKERLELKLIRCKKSHQYILKICVM